MLQNGEYKEYINSIIKLVSSMVIKLDMVGYTMNDFLTKTSIPVSTDPYNQRYYKLLSGEYFRLNLSGGDSPIYIRSIDTQERILFSKSNLEEHPKTLSAFQERNSIYYNNLVNNYPQQEFLINRIVFPLNIDEVINSIDGTILYYDTSLVESNEITLIKSVQLWIYTYLSRYGNVPYYITDSLYASSFLAILKNNLITVILNHRLKRLKTYEAHSFHRWQYLAGYLKLDLFKRRITLNQSLFLYKNIEYIIHSSGRKRLLNFLYNNLLSNAGLNLRDIYLRKSNSNVLFSEFTISPQSVNLDPEVLGSVNDVINDNLIDNLVSDISTKDILTSITQEALLNKSNLITDIVDTDSSVISSNSTNIPSGIIECSNRNLNSRSLIDYETVTLNYWFYLVSNNLFNHNATIEIPYDKSILKTLSIKDWTAILFYCILRIKGELNTDTIPKVYVDNILIPSSDDVDNIGGLLIDDYRFIHRFKNGSIKVIDNLNDVLDDIKAPYEVTTLPEFYDQIKYVSNRLTRHVISCDIFQVSDAQSQLEDTIFRLYKGYNVTISDYDTFTQLFEGIGQDLSTLTDQEAYDLSTNIVSYVTGVDTNSKLKDPQKALLEILKMVSSYTIKFTSGSIGVTNVIKPIIYQGIYPLHFTSITSNRSHSILSHNMKQTSNSSNTITYIEGIENYSNMLDTGTISDYPS